MTAGWGIKAAVLRMGNVCMVGAVLLTSVWHAAQAEGETAMTATEVEALMMAVARCWNVGSLPEDALAVTVIVGATLDRAGKPVPNSIRMDSFEGGTAEAAQAAFTAARRAIIRCGVDGYDLPPEKYDVWKDLSLVFDTRGMQMQ